MQLNIHPRRSFRNDTAAKDALAADVAHRKVATTGLRRQPHVEVLYFVIVILTSAMPPCGAEERCCSGALMRQTG